MGQRKPDRKKKESEASGKETELINTYWLKITGVVVAVASIVIYTVIFKLQAMTKDDDAKALFQKFWDWRLKENPEFGTFIGDHTYDEFLESYSLHAFEKRQDECRKNFLKKTNELLTSTDLSDVTIENLKLFKEELDIYLEGMKSKGYLFPINQLEGVHIEFERLVAAMDYKSADDYNKLISRLWLLPVQIDEIISLMKEGIKLGMTNHVLSMGAVSKQLDAVINLNTKDSVYYSPILKMPLNIDSSEREQLARTIEKIIDGKILPSFKKLKAFIEGEYKRHLRPEIGVSSLPNGKAFYRLCLKFHLGFETSPEEVHQIGLDEVKRINSDMLRVIKSLELNMTAKDFSVKLKEDKGFYFDSSEELLEAYRGLVHKKIEPKLPQIIKTIPKSELSIVATPPSMADGPAAYYLGGTLDGQPGVFYVNTAHLHENPKYNMITLSLHEAVPGHHLQWSCMVEKEDLPAFRRYVEDRKYSDAPSRFALHTAYLEGWGLYSESLGYELDLYDDPYFEFGHLSYEMLRACRLVVDTGLHAFGWSREKAVEYMVENTAMHKYEVEKEVDRYITWPGQACAYKIGQLKIKELRKKAEEILGTKFNIRDFHDVVLHSAGPLSLLEENVDKYIDEVGKAD